MSSRRTARTSRFARAARLAPIAGLALIGCSNSAPVTNTAGERRPLTQQAGVARPPSAPTAAPQSPRPNLCAGRQSPLPSAAGLVNDFAKVIDARTKTQLESELARLKESAGVEFAVVTVETTGGRDIFDYSLDVACGWGVGPGENEPGGGLLLLVATKDRRWRVQVSRALETRLTDDEVEEIGGRMVEHFKRDDFGKGISAAVRECAARLASNTPGPKPTP